MKNYKQLIIGLVLGATITTSISVLANYIVNPNPYPVKIDGQEVALEGYNINDKTYFQLRDIGDKVGFKVGFDNGVIVVNTDGNVPSPTSSPVPTVTPTPPSTVPTITPVPTVTPNIPGAKATPNPKLDEGISIWFASKKDQEWTLDGLPIEVLEDGQKYVNTGNIEEVYEFDKYKLDMIGDKLYGNGGIKDSDILLSNIPNAPENIKNNLIYFPVDYYESTLLPFLQEYCK